MTIQTAGFFILGFTLQGKKFRPSDWAERIASTYGRFDERQRIHYNPMVMPARYDNQTCLFVAAKLANLDPAGYKFIMEFVRSNQLAVKTNANSNMTQSPAELQFVA